MSDSIERLTIRRSSLLSGFYRLSPEQRRARLVQARWLDPQQAEALGQLGGFNELDADAMGENVVGLHGLPLSVALNFVINDEERLIPMAVEEPSVVAAASYAAKLIRAGGGFQAEADPPILAAQVQLLEVRNGAKAIERILGSAPELLAQANRLIPRMVERGGGARELEVRELEAGMLCVHVHVDCRDAMGANTVNAVAEGLAPALAALAEGRVGLRILSNLSDRRRVRARVRVLTQSLASEAWPEGAVVRDAIVAAQRFAELDPYRAVTHNKGVMNGVDAVLLATGNDWRAVEAGAHAWASRHGRYQPLTRWRVGADGALEGEVELPLATSIVGGAARAHPGVRRALALSGASSATDLARLAACAGLSSNLAALKALSTEGIQKGHMALHARRVAAEAGASGELIDLVAQQLSREQVYRPERASELLTQLTSARSAR